MTDAVYSTSTPPVTNSDRADWADTALMAFWNINNDGNYPLNPEERPEQIADLICDLLHLSERDGGDPIRIIQTALSSYE